VLSEGEWWDATVAKVKEEKIRVHYVGGNDEEDEWVPLNRCAQRRSSCAHMRAWRGTLPTSRAHVRTVEARTAPYASLRGLACACACAFPTRSRSQCLQKRTWVWRRGDCAMGEDGFRIWGFGFGVWGLHMETRAGVPKAPSRGLCMVADARMCNSGRLRLPKKRAAEDEAGAEAPAKKRGR
jgi:hypothetical protein